MSQFYPGQKVFLVEWVTEIEGAEVPCDICEGKCFVTLKNIDFECPRCWGQGTMRSAGYTVVEATIDMVRTDTTVEGVVRHSYYECNVTSWQGGKEDRCLDRRLQDGHYSTREAAQAIADHKNAEETEDRFKHQGNVYMHKSDELDEAE
jgi:hypothetical protein